MAESDPQKNRSGWRRATPSGSFAPQPSGPKRGWTGGNKRDVEEAAKKNFFRQFFAGTLIVVSIALIAIVAWYIAQIPVSTPLLMLSIVDYADPLPPNAWAKEDWDAFSTGWAPTADDGFRLYPLRLPKTSRNVAVAKESVIWSPSDGASALANFRDRLKLLQPGGPEEEAQKGTGSVIIYLSAHGILDDKGEPCLILPHEAIADVAGSLGAEPSYLQESRLLPVNDLLKSVGENLPPACRKLLILDCNRIDVHFGLGVLYNGFADKLKVSVANAGVKNLSVMCSAEAGEIGWASPELRGSVFATFVRMGLLGHGDANEDGEISLMELHKYVNERTSRQVARFYDEQHTFLLPEPDKASDYGLAYAKVKPSQGTATLLAPQVNPVKAASTGEPGVDVWSRIDELWKMVDAASPFTADTAGPNLSGRVIPWEALRQGLVRLEALRMSGDAYREQAERLENELTQLAKEQWPWLAANVNKDAAAPPSSRSPITWHSLPAARSWGDLRDSIDKNIRLVKRAIEGPPIQPPETPPYLERAAAAWYASTFGAGRVDFAKLNDFVRGTTNPLERDPEPIEYRFLRLMQSAPPSLHTRTAFQTRNAAEQTAACLGDERVQYWVRRNVEDGDRERRTAEDLLFVGDDQDAVDRSLRTAQDKYKAARDRAEELRGAFRMRDRAWADLPHYARWLTRRSSPQEGLAADEQPLIDLLNEAAPMAGQLGKKLEDQLQILLETSEGSPIADEAVAEGLREIDKLVRRIEAVLTRLEDAFQRATQDLVSESADNDVSRRKSLDLLAVPLVKAGMRQELRRRVVEHEVGTADLKGLALPKPSESLGPWLSRWREKPHPAWQLLQPQAIVDSATPLPGADSIERDKARMQNQGREIRAMLRTTPPQLRERLTDAGTAGGESSPTAKWFRMRSPRSEADQQLRRTASFLPSSWLAAIHSSKSDPTRRLQEYDLHALLIWHGRRACEDFWGPLPDRGNPSYFVTATKDYGTAARSLLPSGSPLLSDLDSLLKDRAEVKTVLTPRANPALRPQSGAQLNVQFAIGFPDAIPAGLAAFYLQRKDLQVANSAGRRSGVQVQPGKRAFSDDYSNTAVIDVPASAEPAAAAPSADEAWQLVGYYRGHEGSADVKVDRVAPGNTIVFERPEPTTATVLVRGEDLPIGKIALILDCSGSMNQSDGGAMSRMTYAKKAVNTIANALAEGGGYRFSLWFYGHRVGYADQNDITKLNRREDLWPAIPKQMKPEDDVERVWDDFLTTSTLKDLREMLGKPVPHGVTPMFLSMQKALEQDMLTAPATAPRHLIVVTDGDDTGRNVTAADVVRLLKADANNVGPGEQRINVSVIGCGRDIKQSLDDLATEMRRATLEVNIKNPQDADELTKTLRDALRLYDYRITTLDTDRSFGPAVLNKPIDVRNLQPGTKAWHAAELISTNPQVVSPFYLEGGESLELFMEVGASRNDFQLVHKRFDFANRYAPNNREAEAADVPAPPTNGPVDLSQADAALLMPKTYYVLAGPPIWSQNREVQFAISIQNGDRRRFSPRPAEAWVEITPLVADRPIVGGRKYVFYDLKYRESVSVPVIECTAPDWPKEARSARIEMWWRPTASKPTQQIRLADIDGSLNVPLGEGASAQYRVKVDEVPGSGVQVSVSERRLASQQGAVNRTPVRVRLSGTQAPKAVRHTYTASGDAEHIFVLRGVDKPRSGNYELQVTTSEDVRRNAVTLPADRSWLTVRLQND